MTQAVRLLDLITEFGNPISIYTKYIFLRFPKVYEETFLLSFAISAFFLFSKFENSNEISIYFLSGINKFQIYKKCILFSFILFIFYLFLSVYISPLLSFKGRELLGKSEFNLINSLVKEGNFNSPLDGLTIYVNENDEKGNLKGIFIYEKNRTIIAEKGEVLSNNNGYYLKLINGTTQEKINDNFNIIKFQSTIFDFSKFSLRNTTYPKFSERNIFWIYSHMNDIEKKYKEIREEFNKRAIKPFFIFILCTFVVLL
jgi:lipopolysaccharide export system permease protein